MTRGLAPLDATRKLNRAAEKQKLLGNCCFTRIRVRDNGKGAS